MTIRDSQRVAKLKAGEELAAAKARRRAQTAYDRATWKAESIVVRALLEVEELLKGGDTPLITILSRAQARVSEHLGVPPATKQTLDQEMSAEDIAALQAELDRAGA